MATLMAVPGRSESSSMELTTEMGLSLNPPSFRAASSSCTAKLACSEKSIYTVHGSRPVFFRWPASCPKSPQVTFPKSNSASSKATFGRALSAFRGMVIDFPPRMWIVIDSSNVTWPLSRRDTVSSFLLPALIFPLSLSTAISGTEGSTWYTTVDLPTFLSTSSCSAFSPTEMTSKATTGSANSNLGGEKSAMHWICTGGPPVTLSTNSSV